MPLNTLFSFRARDSWEDLRDPRHREWGQDLVTLERDWLGRSFLQEQGLHWKNLTQVASLWSPEHLLFLVECWFETLDGEGSDSIELILRPENCEDYFHFEIGARGDLVDSHVREPRVDLDYRWESRCDLDVKVNQEERIWRALMRLPVEPLIGAGLGAAGGPEEGVVWGLNVGRTAGPETAREFAVWRPPYTPQPDFHQTGCLGNLFFLAE